MGGHISLADTIASQYVIVSTFFKHESFNQYFKIYSFFLNSLFALFPLFFHAKKKQMKNRIVQTCCLKRRLDALLSALNTSYPSHANTLRANLL